MAGLSTDKCGSGEKRAGHNVVPSGAAGPLTRRRTPWGMQGSSSGTLTECRGRRAHAGNLEIFMTAARRISSWKTLKNVWRHPVNRG
ncbi:hypothetical protein GGR01_001964 [Acetobacter oeni]|nr:hypothetical protein [Acetobacter oeni]